MAKVEQVLRVAMNEIGYKEKSTNANLESKTANAGNKNWNKYAKYIDTVHPDFYNGKKNGFDWCDIFVDYCFIIAYGKQEALRLLGQPIKSCGAGVEFSVRYYRQEKRFFAEPAVGDQIFFIRNGVICHTGLVVRVDYGAGKVYTIEGNSDNQVAERCYNIRDNTIYGYGRPEYEQAGTMPLDAVVMDVICGKYGNGNDRKHALVMAGYDYKEVQAAVNDFLKKAKK